MSNPWEDSAQMVSLLESQCAKLDDLLKALKREPTPREMAIQTALDVYRNGFPHHADTDGLRAYQQACATLKAAMMLEVKVGA